MKQDRKALRKIAHERIEKLFSEADAIFLSNPVLAKRYVTLACLIARKGNARIPSPLKKQFCKHCKSYLKQAVNVRVRRNEKGIIYTCLVCLKQMRFRIKPLKKIKNTSLKNSCKK